MSSDIDRILVETTKSHRKRMTAAFVFGRQDNRRAVQNNVGRTIGSLILAAVVCVACLGTAFVLNILESNRHEEAIENFTNARATNPIEPNEQLKEDEESGYLVDAESGDLIDPRTGFVIDEDSGLAVDPDGNTIDPRIGWFFDEETGHYTDPNSGITIDPTTLDVVPDED